jgi:indolepyruvate ferredoxin oxidoreductase
MGDSIYSNMLVFGAAWQRGLIPVGREAILKAIELNGAAVERNARAFEIGRWAALHPERAAELIVPKAGRSREP